MAEEQTFVVVGASLAGGTGAATLREEGFDGRLVLIGAEHHPPYERPPLSKEYLRDEQSFEQGLIRPAEWWVEHDVETRFGARVESVDPTDRVVALEGGERIEFDRALIATGGRNRRPPIPGIDLDGVLDLRTIEDADRIKQAASSGGRAVLVGMGFIGAEVAASLRHHGVDVTAIEVFETPLYRVLGPEIGRVLEAIHRDHGVEMVFNDGVERFEGTGRVERVITGEGRSIECDFAVIGVGTEPVADVMRGQGLAANGGIKTDAALETIFPGVFAAGDVAVHDHPVFGSIRVEHFDNAIKMGEHAARNMLGKGELFDDPHWFWSDQYDVNLQMAGFAPEWDRMVVRGSLEERSFCAFLLDAGGVLRSTVSISWPRDVRRSFELIRRQIAPDPDKLADPAIDLRTLVPEEV